MTMTFTNEELAQLFRDLLDMNFSDFEKGYDLLLYNFKESDGSVEDFDRKLQETLTMMAVLPEWKKELQTFMRVYEALTKPLEDVPLYVGEPAEFIARYRFRLGK